MEDLLRNMKMNELPLPLPNSQYKLNNALFHNHKKRGIPKQIHQTQEEGWFGFEAKISECEGKLDPTGFSQ